MPPGTVLVPVGSDAGALCSTLAARMRERRLTFGGRLLCPFLRPFFLETSDEARVARAAEALWRMGERVARAALDDRSLLDDLGLSDAERRLAEIEPGYATSSTAARADAFLLPDSLRFAEYNAESPAGAGYAEGLARVFSETPLMEQFGDTFEARLRFAREHTIPAYFLVDAGGVTEQLGIAVPGPENTPVALPATFVLDAVPKTGGSERTALCCRCPSGGSGSRPGAPPKPAETAPPGFSA